MRDLIDSWQGRETGIEFELDLPSQFPEVDEPVALTIYRVVQEALTNVVRHSGASFCKVSAMQDREWVRVVICDDGKGLPKGDRNAAVGYSGFLNA